MHESFRSLIVISIFVTSFACRSSHDVQSSIDQYDREKGYQRREAMSVGVSPNQCRILATVISIDSSYRSGNSSDPCSLAPCRAIVRVDSILGYGHSFARPLTVGETLAVTFAFTVAPTKNVLPRMTQSYPGVRVGSRIVTDAQGTQSLAIEHASGISFTIFGYSVQ
jgi:hypothetical protein